MPKLGINNNQLTSCPNSPNCVNSQANDDKHSIQVIVIEGSPEQTKEKIIKVLNGFERTKTVTVEDNYIHAESVSKLFRFTDDIEFYFPKTEGNKTTIHVKSASRVGYSDLGANRKRVEQFRSLLNK